MLGDITNIPPKRSLTQKRMRSNMLGDITNVPAKNTQKPAPVKRMRSNPVINGLEYETKVANVCAKLSTPLDSPFCRKTKTAGCSSGHDLVCRYAKLPIPIEIKHAIMEFMQCSIRPDENNCWRSSGRNKIPDDAKLLFESIIADAVIFNGKIPPFFTTKMTYDEWVSLKKESTDFKDMYINCAKETISTLYHMKGCYYIQTPSGLYHTGTDVCKFNVPFFECETRIRIRIKVHKTTPFTASVMCSAVPVNKEIVISPFSLDDETKIPKNLIIK